MARRRMLYAFSVTTHLLTQTYKGRCNKNNKTLAKTPLLGRTLDRGPTIKKKAKIWFRSPLKVPVWVKDP